MKKVIILGATSGIGLEVAKLLWAEGVEIGIAGRRKQILEEIAASMGDRVTTKVIDVTSEDAKRPRCRPGIFRHEAISEHLCAVSCPTVIDAQGKRYLH